MNQTVSCMVGCLWIAVLTQAADEPAQPPKDLRANLTLDEIAALPPIAKVAEDVEPLSGRSSALLNRAKSLASERRFTEATMQLDKALRTQPRQPDLHRAMAQILRFAGNRERLRSHADQVIEVIPDDPVAQLLLGQISAEDGRPADAIQSYRIALRNQNIDQAPDVASIVHHELANVLQREGYLAAAVIQHRAFEEAASLAAADGIDDDDAGFRELFALTGGLAGEPLSVALEELGRNDEAAAAMGRVVAAKPEDATARARWCRMLVKAGEPAKAADEARQIKDSTLMAGVLAEILAQSDRPEESIHQLRELAARNEDNVALSDALIDALLRNNHLEEAESILNARVEKHPDQIGAYWRLFDLHRTGGAWDKAFDDLSRALASSPDDAGWGARNRAMTLADDDSAVQELLSRSHDDPTAEEAYLLGVVAAAAKKWEQAQTLLEESLSGNPGLSSARAELAETFLATYQWQRALEEAKKGVESARDKGRFERIVALAYAGLSDDESAEAHFLKAIELNRTDSEAMFELAQLYERRQDEPLNSVRKAKRQYEALLEVDPLHQPARESLFRLLIRQNDTQAAAEQIQKMKRLGFAATRIARCTARMTITGQQAPDWSIYRAMIKDAIDISEPDADSLFDIAQTWQFEGKLEEARDSLLEALRLDPDHESAMLYLVQIEEDLLAFDRAAETLKELIRRRPNDHTIPLALARELRYNFELDSAIEILRRKLAGDLSDDLRSDYRRELIGIYDSMSRFDDAIHVLRSWIKEGQEASGEVIDLLRGALVAQYGRAKRAGEILDEVRTWLEADPDEDTQRMLWRDALHNAEAFDECIRWELTWLEEDPLNHNRQERLVETLDEAKKYEEALELVHTFEESADSQWASRFAEQRALVLDSAGRSEEAARKMGSMIIEADNPRRSAVPGAKLRLYQMQCAFLISAGKVEEAISTLSRLHRETDEPAEKYVYLNLISTCHQATGRLSQQAEALELAYQISPADAGVNNDLGYTWTELGKNLDKAESMIRAALADDPLNPAFLDSMGWICYKKGRFKEAKKWLQRASFPTRMEDPVIHDHLGDTLWRMGESDLAKTHWQKASKLASEQLSAKPAPMNEPDIRAVMESTQTKVRQLDQGETPSAAALASELPANQATDSSINNDKAMEGSES